LERTIKFLKYKWVAIGFSLTLFAVFTAGTIVNGGFNMGVDFVGGVKIIAEFDTGVDEAKIRTALSQYGPSVQRIGQDDNNQFIISIKLSKSVDMTEEKIEILKADILKNFTKAEFLSVENVGPAIGDFLKKSAVKLIIIALVLMSLYLAFRFELKFSAGAMLALVHDILIAVVFCGFAGVEINVPVIAAFLTVFGYSVNDTIVIFDRIRENINMQTKISMNDLIDRSINQTLKRSIITSLTTLFSVFALYLLGGDGINEFALVLLVGISVGTYSSIFIASPVLLWWERFAKK
jgi:preprotein translocase SecF subunit